MGLIFQGGNASAGIAALAAHALTINGSTPTASVSLIGNSADPVDTDWTDELTANTLDEAGGGSAIYGADHGAIIDGYTGVYSDGTNYFAGPDNSYGDIDTEDAVVEFVAVADTGTSHLLAGKYNGSTGWFIYASTTNQIRVFLDGSAYGSVNGANNAHSAGALYHFMVALDRSGNGASFVNGVANGAASDISSVGSISVADELDILDGRSGYYAEWEQPLFLFQMWKQASWLASEDIQTVAQERSAVLFGHYAATNTGGSKAPTTL